MNIEQASVFLSGSILTAIGFIVIVVTAVVINNILHKYWKPVRIFTTDSWSINPPARYATSEELDKVAPHMDNKRDSK